MKRHSERSTRTWRKLHLAADASTGEILASELTTNEAGNATQVGPLLDQVPDPFASVMVDDAYDGGPAYRAVARHQPDLPMAVVVPPRSTAVPSANAGTAPSQRDQHTQASQEQGLPGGGRKTKVGCSALGRMTRLGTLASIVLTCADGCELSTPVGRSRGPCDSRHIL